MVRGISFDLFDTLVDQNHDRLMPVEVEGRRLGATTPAVHARAQDAFGVALPILDFARAMRDVDRELRVDTIDRGAELPTRDRFRALGAHLAVDDPARFADALTEVHMGALHAACSIPEHHENVLVSLAVERPLALCSNFSHAPTARAILDEARFSRHLASVVISEEHGFRKPRPEIFESVVEALDVPAASILHVGDNLVADVQGAALLGMQTVWLTRQIADPDAALAAYEGPLPDFALEDLMDLPVLVARLGR